MGIDNWLPRSHAIDSESVVSLAPMRAGAGAEYPRREATDSGVRLGRDAKARHAAARKSRSFRHKPPAPHLSAEAWEA